jgi:transposase InsO family protein
LGTKGTVWQYTAIEVASVYAWATLQVTPAATLSDLARTVAADLAARGWRLEWILSDNASEFPSTVFGQTVARLGAQNTLSPLLQHPAGPHRPLDPRPHPEAVLGTAKLWHNKR